MAAEGNNLNMSAIQAMIAEMLKKQEETLLTAMTNQRQSIMEEVRGIMDQTLQTSAPQTNANPSLAPTNTTITAINLDHFQEGEQVVPTEREKKLMDRLEAIEKTLKAIKRHDDLMDVDTLFLFPDARLPPKFKMPEMDKFDGTSCPKTHLKIYVGAMKSLGIGNELLA